MKTAFRVVVAGMVGLTLLCPPICGLHNAAAGAGSAESKNSGAAVETHDSRVQTGLLVLYESCYVLYYVGWEIFFRGLLVLGLEKRLGAFAAVGVSTLVSTAIHYGKPQGEVLAAAIAGFLLGWLVLRTRSLLGPLVFHAATGLLTDTLVLFQTGHLR